MKRKLLSLLLIVFISACAPSAESIQTAVAQTQASYTSTPTLTPTATPSPTPTATPTPNVAPAYFSEYLPYMIEWHQQFENFRDLNRRIADDSSIVTDETFQDEISLALIRWEQAAKNAADITPPNEDLKRFQEMAEELHAQTKIYTSLYITALSGNQAAADTIKTALDRAGEMFIQIGDEIEKGNYIP